MMAGITIIVIAIIITAIMSHQLGIDNFDVRKLSYLIRDTIDSMNNNSDETNDVNMNVRQNRSKFSPNEVKLIQAIRDLDIDDKRNGKDYFPFYMTNVQIMQAIKEAYMNSEGISEIIIQRNHDRRNDEESDPVIGKKLYEGVSNSGMVIQFYYNFDLNLIEDAYPVLSNSNTGKD